MDVYDKLYTKCTFCLHPFCEHYSTYTLNAPNRNSNATGCSVKYIPPGEKYEETVTVESKLLACPCRGFSEILVRNERGEIIS